MPTQHNMTGQQKTLLSIVVAIAVLGGGIYTYNRYQISGGVIANTAIPPTPTRTDTNTKKAEVTLNFDTPGGVNTMMVRVSMASGVINDVSFIEQVSSSNDRTSIE